MVEANGQQNDQSQGWQKADARILGQILAAQNVVFALPDTIHIAEFYAQTLLSIPGIIGCRVCLGNKSIQVGEMQNSVCGACETLRSMDEKEHILAPVDSNFQCNLMGQSDIRIITIDSYQHHFGFFVSRINNTAAFDVYHPFIHNLSSYVAVILENRLQKDWLQKARDELERKVEDRTHDLMVANEELDAARLAALDSVQEAVEARQRIEQANTDLQREAIERKHVEEALRASEQKLEEAARIAHVGYWERDFVAESITLSDEACQIFGLPLQNRLPKLAEWHVQWLNLIHPEDQPRVTQILTDALAGGPPYNVDYRVVRPDGEVRNIHSYAELIRDELGKPLRMFGTMIDITERKRTEEEIRRLNQELEQRVVERTFQLESANKELEAFAYSVSHDLRAPLRHIDGFIALLQNQTASVLDDQSQHYMDMIAESAKKMGFLIDDLLSFSRMGRNDMVESQVDLNELVREVVQEARPETEGRNIRWEIASLPVVTGDRAMLKVVLTNLISNALKFTRPRQQAEIEIGCMPDQKEEVGVFVRDNGVGFNMDYVDKLFGVFQRLHRADEFEGTGIGLANVRRIISRHGGRTWAESEIDHGTTIYFSLPKSNA